MTDQEKLAADLLAAERVIQLCRCPATVAAAKAWLRELEHEALRLTARAAEGLRPA